MNCILLRISTLFEPVLFPRYIDQAPCYVCAIKHHFFNISQLSTSIAFIFLEQDTYFLLTGGVEKVLRVYDMNRPDAAPREVAKTPGSVRAVTWLHSDQTILSSCTDSGGVRYGFVSSTEICQNSGLMISSKFL